MVTIKSDNRWERKRPPTRGPRPSLTTGEIAQAAIRIADLDGLEAVTMQHVARDLGVTTMALYRYFPGKAELLAAMIESAGDPADFLRPSLSWKTRLRSWAHLCADIYCRHPWFLEATTLRRTPMGPGELAWMEAALSMLAEAGLAPRERYNAFLAIIGLVRGHATFQQIKSGSESPQKWVRELAQSLRSTESRYPVLEEVLKCGAFTADSTESFDFALNCILEGIPVSRRGAKRALGSRRSAL